MMGPKIPGLRTAFRIQRRRAVDDLSLREGIIQAKEHFGVKCPDYTKAVTIRTIRQGLEKSGIRAYSRPVFIRGIPIEIDLLIPRLGVQPGHDLLFEPLDIRAACYIEPFGSTGEGMLELLHQKFNDIHGVNKRIQCCFVAFEERAGFKWTITEKNLNNPVYTLFWRMGTSENEQVKSSGDWERLKADMIRLLYSTRRTDAA